MSDEANKQVKSVIWRTTVASAALGVVLSPIPLANLARTVWREPRGPLALDLARWDTLTC